MTVSQHLAPDMVAAACTVAAGDTGAAAACAAQAGHWLPSCKYALQQQAHWPLVQQQSHQQQQQKQVGGPTATLGEQPPGLNACAAVAQSGRATRLMSGQTILQGKPQQLQQQQQQGGQLQRCNPIQSLHGRLCHLVGSYSMERSNQEFCDQGLGNAVLQPPSLAVSAAASAPGIQISEGLGWQLVSEHSSVGAHRHAGHCDMISTAAADDDVSTTAQAVCALRTAAMATDVTASQPTAAAGADPNELGLDIQGQSAWPEPGVYLAEDSNRLHLAEATAAGIS